jgi:autotransporter-associated beta strand protein
VFRSERVTLRVFRVLLATVLGGLAVFTDAQAQTTVYWDVNGSTAGSSGGTTATGVWDQNTTANWTTNSGGTTATGTWQSLAAGAGIATFAAAANATGPYTVTVNGTVTGVRGITFEEGTVTLSGGTLSLAGNATFNTGTNTAAISSAITGNYSVTKSGAGLLNLSGNNSFSGGTLLQAGTLAVGSDTALGTGTLSISGGATLQAAGGARTLANAVATTTDFTIAGSNDLTLAGALTLGGGNRVITIANSGITTFAGTVSNSWYANITKAGSGTLVLSGSNNLTGPVIVSAGALELRNSNALGSATSGNSIAAGAELRLAGGITVNESSFSLQGTGTTGAGVLRNLAGANTLGGTLNFGGTSTIGLDAGSLTLTGTADLGSAPVTIAGAGDLNFAGVIGGSGALVLNGSGTTTISGSSSNYNSGGVTLNSGTLVFAKSGSNAVQTGVTVNGGTLRLGAANQIADYVGVTITSNTGTFDLNNFSDAITGLTLTGSTVTTGTGTLTLTGAFTGNAAATTATITGNLALGGNNTFAIADGAAAIDLSLAGPVSGASGFVKSGLGTMFLSGVNTYTGATTISQGTLLLGGSAPSGAAGVLGNATSAVTLNDANTGTAGTALLATISGTTINRSITVAAGGGGTTLGTDASLTTGTLSFTGNLLLNRDTFIQALGTTNVSIGTGVISGTGGLTKNGTGTLTLSGTNTYSGTTTVSQGSIVLNAAAPAGAAGALGNSSSAVVINDNNTGANDTALTIATAATVGRAITVANAGSGTTTLGGDATLTSGTATFTGNITLARGATMQAFGTSNVAFNTGIISGAGGILKTGVGTVTLGSTNTFSGGVTVAQGMLLANVATGATYVGGFAALGDFTGLTVPTTIVTVASGATLAVQSGYTGSASAAPTRDKQILSLSGAGYNGAGALRATGGVSSWLGSIDLAGDSTITNTGVAGAGADVLYLGPWSTTNSALFFNLNNHALTLNGTGNIAITEAIGNAAGDTGSVTLTGGASNTRYTYAGLRNYYTGATNLNSGVLRLQINPGGSGNIVTANTAILGDLNIGIGSATTTATVQLAAANQIADNVNVTINADGTLDLGTYGMTETLGHITLNRGTISLMAANYGTLYLGGVTSGANIDVVGAGTSTISGNNTTALELNNLGGTARLINVDAGSTLNVTTRVSGGSFIKDGAGTMILSADSSTGYSGTTEVRNGILSVRNANALGLTQNGTVAAAQTVVANGATLQLQSTSGNISFAPESLVISGSGYGGAGALENVAGNNTWTGGITLAADSTVKADSGTTLTVNGTIDGSATTGNAQTLTVGGTGNTTIVGPISNGTGGGVLNLAKNDAGTVTLANVNWFTGSVAVNAGTLAIGITNALGAQTNTVSVASGATLALSGGNSYTTTIAALTGAGTVTIAASTNLKVQNSVADTFSGTLSGAGLFQKAGAGTLTFSSASNTSAFNFAGTLQLDAGTLEFQGGSSSNALTLGTLKLGGGTLLLTNSFINVGTLNITANTILDFGTGGASILNANNIYIAAGVTLTVVNWTSEVDFLFANVSFRQTNASGTSAVFNAIGSNPENQIVFQGDPFSPDGSRTTWTNNWGTFANHQIRPIPEPATTGAILVGSVLPLLLWWRRRK